MTTNTDNTMKLLATLRRVNPFKVRAYTSDDDFRDIAVPTRRRKWAQVIEAIEAKAWSKCELLDKSGAVLGYIENVEPAMGLEDIAPDNTKANKFRSDTEWVINLVLKAQERTMHYRDSEMTTLLREQGNVVRAMGDATAQLAAVYRDQVVASQEAAEARVNAVMSAQSEHDGFSAKDLAELMPMLPQVLPMLRALLQSGSAPNPKPPTKGT